MAEIVGNDDSEFGSVTSSQRSFLNRCPFADPNSIPTKSSDEEVLETDSDNTEVLGNPISPPVISYSSQTSLDSINDDVFRTPPENPSLSSAPNSQSRVRVSELTPKLKSPSPKPDSTPIAASPSLPVDNARVPVNHLGTDSIGRIRVLENQPISTSPSSSSEAGNFIPFKEIIEALVRNNGDERDEQVSYVNILKQCGLKFP